MKQKGECWTMVKIVFPQTGHVFVFIFSRFDEKCLNRKMNDSCHIRKLQCAISITLYFYVWEY